MSLFVAVSGAFGVSAISAAVRYPAVLGLALALSLVGLVLAKTADRLIGVDRPVLRAGVVAVAGWLAGTLICWGIAWALEGDRAPRLQGFAGPCALMMVTIAGLDVLTRAVAERRRTKAAAAPFGDRLPHRLRGASILALQGEDHFVRIHTERGEHLLWMRLGDAIEELTGVEGVQTHRSWWVAKSAVLEVKRGNGRATLTLSNGLKAPVSRRYSGMLRADGWY